MAADPNKKRVNPEDEVFWKKVREAHDVVIVNPEMTVDFELGNKAAAIYSVGPDDTHDNYMVITIREVTPDQPTLVVP